MKIHPPRLSQGNVIVALKTLYDDGTSHVVRGTPYAVARRMIVTDKLQSYGVAHRQLIPVTIHRTAEYHSTEGYANNGAELSHPPTRVRKPGMRLFNPVKQAQRFLNSHATVYSLFDLGRH